ncbi:class I SAM-dependent methyltransferase [Aquihabitans daechungensis]|uniref:class I SAM-dependent methyltransferase n=1 Tax=Aquihabitans daechungensis TaxID=1052257 RepID=UPI003BA28764
MTPADPPATGATGGSRWTDRTDVARGADYDQRFERLAASGKHVHGEADLVAGATEGPRILDAGCGTGRVAIELAARGYDVTGIDLDGAMLAAARRKAPHLTWIEGDLATMALDAEHDAPFDTVVLAGNVLIFVAPGSEGAVIDRCARHLADGGLLIAGFQVHPDGFGPDAMDHAAEQAGLELLDRWATWDRRPWSPGGGYQVSVHRRR